MSCLLRYYEKQPKKPSLQEDKFVQHTSLESVKRAIIVQKSLNASKMSNFTFSVNRVLVCVQN